MQTARTIVIGDVHGCRDELEELLLRVEFRQGKDRLVFAGDVLDRGPDPVGVLRRVQELQAEMVLGNHEEKHLRFHANDLRRRRNPRHPSPARTLSERARAQHATLTAADFEFMQKLPPYIRLDANWLVVHGGFEPGRSLEQQKPTVMVRMRYVDGSNQFVPIHRRDPLDPHTVFWTTRWQGPENVVYGHHVQDLQNPRIEEPRSGVFCYGLDTGCCFGGRLTALLLPQKQIVQVSARQPYAPLQMDD